VANRRFRIVGSNSGGLKIAVWDVTPFGVTEILPTFRRNLQLKVEGKRIMNFTEKILIPPLAQINC
jgi:hypothetical protein